MLMKQPLASDNKIPRHTQSDIIQNGDEMEHEWVMSDEIPY